MKIMVTSFKRSHAGTATLSAPNPGPAGHHRLTLPSETPGHSWASLGPSLVGPRLSPGSHCSFLLVLLSTGFVCALQESISQSYLSSGSSVVGLMVTPSKRAYAIPTPRAPVPAPDHCRPAPPQETLTVLSQSLWGPWVLVCTRFV